MSAQGQAPTQDQQEHEALLQFLYMAPVGLVQLAADGTILMLNPLSAQLLMPLSADGALANLFDALAPVAPGLRQQCAAYAPAHGLICDASRLQLRGDGAGGGPQVLSLTMLKLDAGRLMAVLSDVTAHELRERQLRKTSAWLDAILHTITDYALVSLDQLGCIESWNDSIGRVTGYDAAAALGQPYTLFSADGIPPEQLQERLREADAKGWTLDQGLRRRADGSQFWASSMISPLPERGRQGDREPAYCMIIRDMTEPAAAATEGDDAYETLIQFLYRAPVALIQLQHNGEIEMLNPMASQLLMPLAQDGELGNLFQVLQPYAPDLRQLCTSFEGEQGVVCEGKRIGLRAEAGRTQQGPEVLSLGLLKVDGRRLMAVLLDATHEVIREQRTLASRLASAARVDVLTRLPNRAGALDLLRNMAQRARLPAGDHGAVMFISLERFRLINATFGNEVGDQVMVLVAERLRATVRGSGRVPGAAGAAEVAARVGGDEFAVLLDGLPDAAAAERIGSRLLDRLGKPYRVADHDLACTFSIGIVMLEQGGQDADGLLRDAAIAVAGAKAQGGGRCVLFQRRMREEAVLRGGLEADLRLAVERGELFTVYQPVVGLLADGLIDRSAGVEALVRWRHPVRGMVGPVEFIGIAEDCGLIDAIGEQVLAMACGDFVRWQALLGERAPRLLAVNLSRAQLSQQDLCGKVAAILAATGMAAEQLQLEITESLAAQGQDIQAQLLGLKAMGIKLALDDFGTGYSSLSSLHLLPVDTVKIDRSFITLAATSRHHEVLIEATVKVARSLGMNTVAEGIETPQQAAVVSAQGCDKGQGYLFSRPISSAAIEEWLGAEGGNPWQ